MRKFEKDSKVNYNGAKFIVTGTSRSRKPGTNGNLFYTIRSKEGNRTATVRSDRLVAW